jgi:hypothetical protein
MLSDGHFLTSRGHGVWVPAFAGTTVLELHSLFLLKLLSPILQGCPAVTIFPTHPLGFSCRCINSP